MSGFDFDKALDEVSSAPAEPASDSAKGGFDFDAAFSEIDPPKPAPPPEPPTFGEAFVSKVKEGARSLSDAISKSEPKAGPDMIPEAPDTSLEATTEKPYRPTKDQQARADFAETDPRRTDRNRVTLRQVGKDFKGGIEQVKGLVTAAEAFGSGVNWKVQANAVEDMDAIDAGGAPAQREGGVNAPARQTDMARMYEASPPETRVRLRQRAVDSMLKSQEFVASAADKIQKYNAEQEAQSGKLPDFTDTETVGDFVTWAVRNGVATSPTMAVSMLGAVAGVPGLMVTSLGMAIGDMTQARLDNASGTMDPARFQNPDRRDEAAAGKAGNMAAKLAANAGTTGVLALPYAALDFAGPAGTLAMKGLKKIGENVTKKMAEGGWKAATKEYAKESAKETAGEFVNEAGQEVVNVGSDIAAGERPNQVTGEDAKRVLNAGAVGAVMGTGGHAANVAGGATRDAATKYFSGRDPSPDGAPPAPRAPTQARSDAVKRFDELSAAHGLNPDAVDRVRKQAEGMPADEVPGFLARVTGAFNKRGLFKKPVDDAGIEQLHGTLNAPDEPPADAGAPTGEPVAPTGGGGAPTVDEDAHKASSSPNNDLPEPTPGQADAGNYQKGHTKIAGLDVSIENPQGSTRRGVDDTGKPWENTLNHHYGYIRGTVGNDDEQVDAFINPGTPKDYSGPVFVVDQINPKTGEFDEHKVLLGFDSFDAADEAYRSNYAPGWKGAGALHQMDMGQFKDWIANGDHKAPIAGDLIRKADDGNDKPDVAGAPPVAAPSGDGKAPVTGGSVGDSGSLAADTGRGGNAPTEAAAPGGADAVPAGGVDEQNGSLSGPVTTFKTSKGSAYVVNGQSTTRDKAARSGAGHEGQSGPQPASERTFYVDMDGLDALGEFQTQGAHKRKIVVGPSRAALQYIEGPDAGKFEKRSDTAVFHEPAVGRFPVELWKDGTVVHFGNEITEVGREPAKPAAFTEDAAAAARERMRKKLGTPDTTPASEGTADKPGPAKPEAALTDLERKQPWAKNVLAIGARARAAGEKREAPGEFTPNETRAWLVGWDEASDPPKAAPAPAPTGAATTAEAPAAPEPPQVFKSRQRAKEARDALGNEYKLQKIKGGYVLRKKSDKEIEAEARNGARIAAGSGKRTLLATIARMGGLNFSERADTISEGNKNVGGKMLFTKDGRTINEVAEALLEAGFIPAEHRGDDGVRWLQDAIQEEFSGRRTYYAESDTESMDDDLEARRLAAQGDAPEEIDPFGPLSDFTADDLEESGYAAASPDVQALTEQLIAEADTLGIDTDTIREDAAQDTEATEEQYHAAIQATLRGAIAEAQANAAGRNAEAASGSSEDRSETDDAQGQEEGLTLEAQTEADLRAKAEREAAAAAGDKEQQAELARAEAKRKRDLEQKLIDERAAKVLKDRIDASADDFQLGAPPPSGKVSRDEAVGQGDLLGAEDTRPTTYLKGDLAAYTGKEVDLHGGHFYEVEMLEGHEKGALKVVKDGPRAADEQQAPSPAWHTDIPAQGLAWEKGDEQSAMVAHRVAQDAVNAITMAQKHAGMQFYAYVKPADGGRHGIARLFPDDQTPPAPWKLVMPEAFRPHMQDPAQIRTRLGEALMREPILGEQPKAPSAKPQKRGTPSAADRPTGLIELRKRESVLKSLLECLNG